MRLRRLAAELRRLRSASQLTRDDVTERTGINGVTLYRIENARVRPQRRTLVGMLDAYSVEEPQRGEILELLKQTDGNGWFRPNHTDLPDEYTTYIGFESEARSVRNYESLFVPGLLQTEDYARDVIPSAIPKAASSEIDQLVQARIERQEAFNADRSLELWTIIDEAALRRLVGGPKVMAAQLDHLVEASNYPNVTLQVIPFGAGTHPGMHGSFVLLDFPDEGDPTAIYIESATGGLFLESDEDIRRYNQLYDHLRAQALSPSNSAGLIAALAKEIK
jgi:transcriptional regulator with XRE-family HTH domain